MSELLIAFVTFTMFSLVAISATVMHLKRVLADSGVGVSLAGS